MSDCTTIREALSDVLDPDLRKLADEQSVNSPHIETLIEIQNLRNQGLIVCTLENLMHVIRTI